jgi:hypothetical protein
MMRKNQRGVTLLGAMLIGFMLVAVAVLGMKLIPAYMEFFSVKKIITAIGKDPALSGMAISEIRKSFDNRANVEYVTVIQGKDLEVSKGRGKTVVTANYSVTIPIVWNISALLEFHTSGSDDSGSEKKLLE